MPQASTDDPRPKPRQPQTLQAYVRDMPGLPVVTRTVPVFGGPSSWFFCNQAAPESARLPYRAYASKCAYIMRLRVTPTLCVLLLVERDEAMSSSWRRSWELRCAVLRIGSLSWLCCAACSAACGTKRACGTGL